MYININLVLKANENIELQESSKFKEDLKDCINAYFYNNKENMDDEIYSNLINMGYEDEDVPVIKINDLSILI